MTIGRDEIFGPVATCAGRDTRRGVRVMEAHPNANATSIFTSSGKSRARVRAPRDGSMVGVNIGVAAPMAYFPFGGARDSFFGDLKVHGRDAFEFYTDKKSRLPGGSEDMTSEEMVALSRKPHDLRVVGAERHRSDSRRARQRRLLLDA